MPHYCDVYSWNNDQEGIIGEDFTLEHKKHADARHGRILMVPHWHSWWTGRYSFPDDFKVEWDGTPNALFPLPQKDTQE